MAEIVTFPAEEIAARPLAHRFFCSFNCLTERHSDCQRPEQCACGCHVRRDERVAVPGDSHLPPASD